MAFLSSSLKDIISPAARARRSGGMGIYRYTPFFARVALEYKTRVGTFYFIYPPVTMLHK